MPTIVALDIETTGLDPQADSIIEIGAVKFNGGREEGKWSSLINPKRIIPSQITQLTGITNDMVMNAPAARDVLPDLVDFIGNLPIIGHNVAFDLSFLRRYKILDLNEVLDTYELASVLLPTSSRYNLGALAQNLNIYAPVHHRALDDARTTQQVYNKLFDIAMTLPVDLVAEFVRLSEQFDWGATWVFKQVLRSRSKEPVAPRQARSGDGGPLFKQFEKRSFSALNPADPPVKLDEDEVAAYMEDGGPFSKYFENYEHRTEQVSMMRSVAHALSEEEHLLVEAGTGVGKSFAYLVPAALWAKNNNTRVVISTNTINLQDQLSKKDIPDLVTALNLDIRSAVLKGRNNYLCPRRLESFRKQGPENPEEMRVLAKIMIWLREGGTGDRNEINLNGPAERDVWSRLCSEDEGCKTEVCMGRMGGTCPYHQSHQAAQSAHLIIVNHALLLSDSASGNRILPEFDYLIIDEAHHLEDATTNSLSFKVTQADLARLLRELGSSNSGILGHLLQILHNILLPADLAAFHQSIERSTDIAFRLENEIKIFFEAVSDFMEEQREGKPVGSYGQTERIIPSTRTLHQWERIEITWDNANETMSMLGEHISQLYKKIGDLYEEIPEELEDSQAALGTFFRRMSETQTNISSLVNENNVENINWLEISPNRNQITMQIAPLHIGKLMEEYLWHQKKSIILTSATLTTNGEFAYLRNRLNADEADESMLGSPFDYESSALLYIAKDMPEPSDGVNYQRMLERTLVQLSKATQGRLLALFTSYSQLKKTSQAIAPSLVKEDIQIFEQGEGASASTLLESFRDSEKAVLLGTRSFWEGVDIPGEKLSVLVIVKLPFDVPSDPIVAARSETFDDPFNEYNLPEAILRFRQGFGRLIRTQSDRGVVAILDSRILTKRYGKLFIDSLPTCTTRIGLLESLPIEAKKWLGL